MSDLIEKRNQTRKTKPTVSYNLDIGIGFRSVIIYYLYIILRKIHKKVYIFIYNFIKPISLIIIIILSLIIIFIGHIL